VAGPCEYGDEPSGSGAMEIVSESLPYWLTPSPTYIRIS
jgi:hypothetical protein